MILFLDNFNKFLLELFLEFFILFILITFPPACPLQLLELIPNLLPKHWLHLPIIEEHLIQSGEVVGFTNTVGESP